MSSTGRRLRESNEEILKYINQLREQRNEIVFLVEKQKTEKTNLEAETARIHYKLNLISKSLNQRVRALALYDATLMEIENKYKGLADSTMGLLTRVRNDTSTLENSTDKRIGTEDDCKNCPKCDPVNTNKRHSSHVEDPNERQSEGDMTQINKSETYQTAAPARPPSYMRPLSILGSPNSRIGSRLDVEGAGSKANYQRAMEYPMMLAPIMKSEQSERASLNVTQSVLESQMAADNRPGNPTQARRLSLTQDGPDLGQMPDLGEVSDADYPDMKPNKDPTAMRYPSLSKQQNDAKNKEIAEALFDTSIEDGNVTEGSVEEEATEAPFINEFDEVIEDAQTKTTGEGTENPDDPTLKKAKSKCSLDVFRQAYKNQHEKNSSFPSLIRNRKSVFNKKGDVIIEQ